MNNSKDIHCSDTTYTAACDDIGKKIFYMANNTEALF